MSEWYYSQSGQQLGPITADQLKNLAASGQLQPGDLIWKDGMAEWTPAVRVKGIFPESGQPAANVPAAEFAPNGAYAPAAAVSPAYQSAAVGYSQGGYPNQPAGYAPSGQIGYYSATSDIGPRTAQIMSGYPAPTGPRGEWPLSDQHLSQLAQTESHRRCMRGFRSLCRLLVFFLSLASVGLFIAILYAATESRSYRRGEEMFAMVMVLAVYAGFAVLYGFCGAAAMKCRVWGPVTALVFQCIGLIGSLCLIIGGAMSRYDGPPMVISGLISAALVTTFLIITIRAIAAIPRFRASPVWCQEALVNAKL